MGLLKEYNSPLVNTANSNCLRALFLLKNLLHQGDYYTYIHSVNVSKYCALIGTELGLSQFELENLRIAALLHDVGKSQIVLELLVKPGRLTVHEFNQIKQHTVYGAQLIRNYKLFSHLSDIILCHHERYDGQGYPQGLRGEEIPFLARIIAVADSFDAMTTDRSYSKKKSVDEAIEELKAHSGTQFDPVICTKMVRLMNQRKAAI